MAHGTCTCTCTCSCSQALEAELSANGANPYSRFKAADLGLNLEGAVAAADERTGRLAIERQKVAGVDATKRQFAEAAEVALAFLKAERAALEERTSSNLAVRPDDPDSISAGKATLEFLAEYAGKAAHRLEQLATAQVGTTPSVPGPLVPGPRCLALLCLALGV